MAIVIIIVQVGPASQTSQSIGNVHILFERSTISIKVNVLCGRAHTMDVEHEIIVDAFIYDY